MYDADFENYKDEAVEEAGRFMVRDSGAKAQYDDGMHRDTAEGKPKFSLLIPRGMPYEETLLYRAAMHYMLGGIKYGDRNWEKSSTPESLEHHTEALWRHFMKYASGVEDGEDHAAAIFWNLNAVLYTKWRLGQELAKADAAAVLDDDVPEEDGDLAHMPGCPQRYHQSSVCYCGPDETDPGEDNSTPEPDRELSSQGRNPSDDEVALAKSILEQRAAFHDREAAELLIKNAPPADVTRTDLPVVPEYDPPLRDVPQGHRKPSDNRKTAMRRWRLVFAAIIVFVISAGSFMISQHGFSFFVFRSAGTGESPDSFLSENQGPGQPDAPRATPLAVKVPVRRAAAKPELVVVSPNTKLTIPGSQHDTWAAIAELHDGSWTLLDAGTKYAAVSAAAAQSWNASPGKYMSEWIILPVHKE
jgi:hypothetical protein